MTKEQVAIQVLNILESQRFADWYNMGRFDSYLTGGDINAPTKEEILIDIIKLFRFESCNLC